MINNNDMAAQTAEFLLTVKAVKLNNEHPFTWASGRKSPIYCDNRVTLSYPEIRTFIRQRFTDIVKDMWGDVDVIAGVATGGIAQGALVAQELGKPFVYVRSSRRVTASPTRSRVRSTKVSRWWSSRTSCRPARAPSSPSRRCARKAA